MTKYRRLKSFFIACLGFLGDVRITRSGKVHLHLRDRRADKKMLKKIRAMRQAQ